MEDAFSRTALLLGQSAVRRLNHCKIALFGIGGVGSFTAEALARAGVGHFVLIDNDRVCLSNLNRQLLALHSTLGRQKVDVMRERILDINPEATVETHAIFCLPGMAAELLTPDLDYVIDAIDTVSAKIDIVETATRMGIPVISCMGAGNKLDPTRFEVADIFDTSVCPLSKVMRRELKKRGVMRLKVVFSQEEPKSHHREAAEVVSGIGEINSEVTETGSAPRRRRAPGSVSFVPSVAGLIIAGEVVKDLVAQHKHPTDPR